MPAGVTSGPATASTASGQAAVLTAINILARAHPGVTLALPDVALMVPCPTGGTSLLEGCELLAVAANPDVEVSTARVMPTEIGSIGIGADAGPASIYAGGDRWTARTAATPQEVVPRPSSLLGAGLAVTLATGFIFRTALGRPAVRVRGVSLWSLAPAEAASGPDSCDPLDVGTVWLIGAGAVGSCLAWWLQFVGVVGAWTVIDGDVVDATNLNRSLGLFATDAGLAGGRAVHKADAAAALIPGAATCPHWWHDWAATDPAPPDVLVPVANEYGVRAAVAAYSHPATLHATTSRNWTAELHRHLLGRDGCISCRLPEGTPSFGCATGQIEPTGTDPGRDAALPFLSAASGLLLLAGLLQMQHGHWATHDRNHWRVWFDDTPAVLSGSHWQCAGSCRATLAGPVRRAIHGETRWCYLDPAQVVETGPTARR